MPLTIASAAYPLSVFSNWSQFSAKITQWIALAAGNGADLALFPEYAAMELASLGGADVVADLEASIVEVARHTPQIDSLFSRLAIEHALVICGPSRPQFVSQLERPVNRCPLYTPDGRVGYQDKLIMTRFENEEWAIHPGHSLKVFETDVATIGIAICYDSEFPLVARALAQAGADIILIPSCTDTLAGYARVEIGAKARALENQLISVVSPTVGTYPPSLSVDINHGAAAIFAPPDGEFPDSGILARGEFDVPGWVYAKVNIEQLRAVRRDGQVLNVDDWSHQDSRLDTVVAGFEST